MRRLPVYSPKCKKHIAKKEWAHHRDYYPHIDESEPSNDNEEVPSDSIDQPGRVTKWMITHLHGFNAEREQRSDAPKGDSSKAATQHGESSAPAGSSNTHGDKDRQAPGESDTANSSGTTQSSPKQHKKLKISNLLS
ncbi:MAG: hypothetical protein Q9162_004864 [Coniocarpon cinnabarinum]